MAWACSAADALAQLICLLDFFLKFYKYFAIPQNFSIFARFKILQVFCDSSDFRKFSRIINKRFKMAIFSKKLPKNVFAIPLIE